MGFHDRGVFLKKSGGTCMKRFIVAAVVVLAVVFTGGIVFAQGPKVACLDLQKVFMDSIQGKEFRATMETLRMEKEKDLDKINENIKKIEDQLGAQSPAKKETSKKDIEDKLSKAYMDRDRFLRDANEEMKKRQETIIKPLEADIDKIVDKYGKENGIDVILNVSAGSVVYFSDQIDITKNILEVFDKIILDRQAADETKAKDKPAKK
jgi:Skp family chaperone for outer membrane proteins